MSAEETPSSSSPQSIVSETGKSSNHQSRSIPPPLRKTTISTANKYVFLFGCYSNFNAIDFPKSINSIHVFFIFDYKQ